MKLLGALAAAALLTAPTFAAPKQCHAVKTEGKVKKGQFIPCPPAGAAGMPSAIVKDKAGRCHWSATENGHTKGQFVKCP